MSKQDKMAQHLLRRRHLFRRWLLASVIFSSPAAAVLAALAATGRLDWSIALAGIAVTAAGLSVLLYGHFRHIAGVQDFVEAAGEAANRDTLPPMAPESGGRLLAPGLRQAIVSAAEERLSQRRELQAVVGGNEAVLDNLPDPLVLLSGNRQVVRLNPAGEALLGDKVVGRDLAAVLRNPPLVEAIDGVLAGKDAQVVTFSMVGSVERHLMARVAALPAPTFDGARAVLLLHDVTGIKRAERLRADFVANASHELRTPLSSLFGFIETLRGPAADDPEAQQHFLSIMHEQAERMSRLVQDLMSLSRIEMEEHTPPTGQADLGDILESAVNALTLKAKDKAMTVEVSLPEDLPAVIGEADELTQVFQNLIDNAIKYGREGTPVRVEAEALAAGSQRRARRLGQPMVAVRVIDRGEGIARQHLPRLTERFYRIDPARSRQLGGTGLGLAIVKHLVNRHRGLLEIDSEVGEGSTFTVVLPVATAALKHRAAE